MAPQRTPLYDVAAKEGAGFLDWCDWELPRDYGDVLGEYTAAREKAAVHDSSYTGRIKATGADVLDLLHRLSTNDVISLEHGRGAPTVLTTDRGRILDLISVLNLGDHVLLLTSPQTRGRVMEWIAKYTIVEDVSLEDVTSQTAQLSIVGPDAHALAGNLTNMELASFVPYQSADAVIAGVNAQVIRTDLSSLPRFDLLVQAEHAENVWKNVIASGARPIGLDAYQALRVEMGAPEYDRELGEPYNPLETGLWGSISFTKGCYIGQEVIARLDTYQKVQRHLVSLSFAPDAQVQGGLKLTREGREVGHVTSVVRVPTTGHLVGLGYVRKEASEVGTQMGLAGNEGAWAKVEAAVLPFGPAQ